MNKHAIEKGWMIARRLKDRSVALKALVAKRREEAIALESDEQQRATEMLNDISNIECVAQARNRAGLSLFLISCEDITPPSHCEFNIVEVVHPPRGGWDAPRNTQP